MRILIIGVNGQLGSCFKKISSQSNHQFCFTNKEILDLTDTISIQAYFNHQDIDVVINCAAYTAVDKAEEELDNAYLVNCKAVENLVKVCAEKNIQLIHISTDYVFDGCSYTPYTELDQVNPLSIYGKSKRAGEEVIINSSISALILRTSWLYSSQGNNFAKTMIKLGNQNRQIKVIYDQVGTPTNALDLAKACIQCIDKSLLWKNKREVYHFSNEGVASWYDFALSIFYKENISCEVLPIRTKDYVTKAKRPLYTVLDKNKIKTDFDITINHWYDSLQKTEF